MCNPTVFRQTTIEEIAMSAKARPVGINHVALEVGNIQEAMDFYHGFLDFEIAP
jgi:catechol-2,3-dioxygenase